MAILVGVVAATVIPYMEKSRKAKDQQKLSSITTNVVSTVAQVDKPVGYIEDTALSDVDDNTGLSKEDATAYTDNNFLKTYSSLVSSDGEPLSETDYAAYVNKIQNGFKSKAYTDKDKGNKTIYIKLNGGITTTYVSKTLGTILDDDKCEAISE